MGVWRDGTQTLRRSREFEDVLNVLDDRFGALGNGVQDDRPAIQAAIQEAYDRGGGSVYIPGTANGYNLASASITLSGKSWCLKALPGVSIVGDVTTKLNLRMTASFFNLAFVLANAGTYITADTLATDTTIAVADSSTCTIGQQVIVELGQSPLDSGEPLTWQYAFVTSIPDATHITLDRPVCFAMSVAGVPTTAQRSVRPISRPFEHASFANLRLVNTMAGGVVANAGFSAYGCRHLDFENITGLNPGAGLFNFQYVEHVGFDMTTLEACAKQGAGAGGRAFSFCECRNIHVRNSHLENCEGSFVFLEASSQAITFDGLMIVNNFPGRSTTAAGLIHHNGYSGGRYKGTLFTGVAASIFSSNGPSTNGLSFESAAFEMSDDPILSSLVNLGEFRVRGLIYTEIKRYSKVFSLAASTNNVCTLPSGLSRWLRIVVTSTTGITSCFMANGVSHGIDVKSSLVAGQQVSMPLQGIGSGYVFNALEGKNVQFVTDGTLPPGTTATIEMEHFVAVGSGVGTTDDGSGARVQA